MTLREGFTTGTAAAAAAKAATLCLLHGVIKSSVDVLLPMGKRLTVPVFECAKTKNSCMCAVCKDGGDDPDVTHKAIIRATVTHLAQSQEICIAGGQGVGRVTRPGLPVAVGEPAINPVPKAQITQAVQEALSSENRGLLIEISVDNGAEIAQKTFNPRLGIIDGISILGTRGTVRPFSHAAYRSTIRQSLSVVRAAHLPRPCLTTGGRSERFALKHCPGLTREACVQVADFFAFSMRESAKHGFTRVLWALFLGKLLKQAQGLASTHARHGQIDFSRLAKLCADSGMHSPITAQVATANTAMQVLDLVRFTPGAPVLFQKLATQATGWAQHYAQRSLQVDYVLFDFSGELLCTTEHAA